MQNTIQYIKSELKSCYPASELNSIVRLVIEWVTGWDFTQQLLYKNQVLQADEFYRIKEITHRLKMGEPFQYITGETTFLGLKLKVTPAVLIPRPETEELADKISKLDLPHGSCILDLCTGSGCIALAVKKSFPGASVSACDISAEALAVANENKRFNQLEVDFFQTDILEWKKHTWQKYDLIVSNPPYVTAAEKMQMQRNVLDFEPGLALFVPDSEPLLFYTNIADLATEKLNPGGFLFFEINEKFGTEMVNMLLNKGFVSVELINDLQGKNRMISARKPNRKF